MPPEPTYDLVRAAELLERLLTDAALRAEFRMDPTGVCASFGLPDLAERLAVEGRIFETLDLRESKSSLAGVLMAAAAEGIGAFEIISHFRDSGALAPDAAIAVDRAFTRVAGMQAITPDQAEAARLGASAPVGPGSDRPVAAGAPAWTNAPSIADHDGAPPVAGEHRVGVAADLDPDDDALRPTCPLCEAKNPDKTPDYTPCERCGAPAPVGTSLCAICSSGGGFRAPEPEALRFGRAAREGGDGAVRLGLADVPAAAAGAGPAVAPVDPSFMSNTNEGGKLHGSEFNMRDAEGAPGPNGRIHAGYDLFGDANAPIRAPEGGVVVEVRPSRGTSGQVFGGTVKVQAPSGRVWVFRHVTPGSVTEGQTVPAGTEVARVSPWSDGPEHTHIEVWKSFSGGYNATNMEDPFPLLKQLYAGQAATPVPAAALPGAIAPGAPVAQVIPVGAAPGVPVPGAIPGAAVPGVPLAAAPVAAPALTPDQLVQGGRVLMPDALRAEFAAGRLDPRVAALVSGFAAQYQIGVSTVFQDGVGVRVIISSVNGQPVGPGNIAARDLAQGLASLQFGRPADVVTPWAIGSPGFRNDPALIDRIELGFSGQVPAGTPVPAVVPMAVPPSPVVAAPIPAPPVVAVPPVVAAPPVVPPVAPPPVVPAPVAPPPVVPVPVAPPPVVPAPVAPPPVVPAPVAPPPVVPVPVAPAPVAPAPIPPPVAAPPVAAAPAAPSPAVPPVESSPATGGTTDPSYGRQSGVFQVAEPAAPPAPPDPPAGVAAPPPAPAAPPVDPAAPVAPAPVAPPPDAPAPGQTVPPPDTPSTAPPSGAASQLPDPTDPYPGDTASKESVARWMARQAQKAGLPPELPVMAALVESGLRNLNYGDADSVGFFQMRVSIWNQGDYAGYPQSAELQLKWFLDQAGDLQRKRLADGFGGFGKDPNAFGNWIADVERPAAQYRGRYQLRLDEARKLIYG